MQDASDLPQTLSAALAEKGYDSLTPVQEAVSAPELAGKDLLVSAQTGSGKTVGFGLAMAPELLDKSGNFEKPALPLAVVIAPTRELALQVRREFDWLFAQAGIVTASAVGGMDVRTERRALERGAHVVVATPGRLRDHISRGVVDLADLRTVVLDEADEMLDMGFAEDLEYILDQTPETRRTLMFSATVPPSIAKLAQKYQSKDAEQLKIGSPAAQHADIAYRALNVVPSDIEKAIVNLLRFHDAKTTIVFANTRSMVARLTTKFSNRGFAVVSLSGELSQAERTNAMQALRDGRAQVCVATDVAARGIDLPGLELVIHADLPSNSETLLHRSGRTGRAGRKGTSILIVPGRHRSKAQRLLKTAKLEADWGAPPSAEEVLAQEETRIIANLGLDGAPNPEELAFSERLLADSTPEQIATAYMRLYRERHAAPEILGTPPEPGAKQGKAKADARANFGPSTWFSLSIGRNKRAEPRWILPMLCRNAGLPKSAIGAIRVAYKETFVEIAVDAVPAMKQELGNELLLEQGAKLTELPGLPDFEASPKGPPAAPYDEPKGDKPRKPRADKPKKAERRSAAPDPDSAPPKVRKPKKGKPFEKGSAKHDGKGKGKPKDKNASDPSKPLGGRKPRHKASGKGGSKSAKPPHSVSRKSKGGEARPFRKPSKRD
ncbi:MAG: DEAD/DEAH box helicase [Pseudomonadota bacterium]